MSDLTDDDIEYLATLGVTNKAEELRQMVEDTACPRCGYPEDSFACRVRHIAVDVSNLKRERER